MRLPGGSVMRVGAGVGAGTLVALGLMPVLSRLYSPAQFGQLGVLTALASLLGGVAALRMDQAVLLATDEVAAAAAYGYAVRAASVVCLGSIPLIYFAGPGVASLSGEEWSGVSVVLVVASAWFIAVYQVSNSWILRQLDHRSLGLRMGLQLGAQSVLPLPVALLGGTGWGLLAGFALSRPIAMLCIWRGRPQRSTSEQRRAVRQRFRRFATVSTPATLVNNLSQYLPALLITSMCGLSVAGQFVLAWRVMSAPGSLAGQAVGPVFRSRLSDLMRNSRWNEVAPLVSSTRRRVAVTIGLPVLLGGLCCPWLIPLVFGAQWSQAGQFAAFLALPAALDAVAGPLSAALDAFEAQSHNLIWDVSRLTVLLVLALYWAATGASPIVVVASLAVWLTVSYGSLIVIVGALTGSISARSIL